MNPIMKKTSIASIQKPTMTDSLIKRKLTNVSNLPPAKPLNKKANAQARKIIIDLESFMFKREKFQKVHVENKECENTYLFLTKEEDKIKNEANKGDDLNSGALAKEIAVLNELKTRLAQCMADLDNKKDSLDAIKDFANKFVTEILQRVGNDNQVRMIDLELLAARSFGHKSLDSSDGEDFDKLDQLRKNSTGVKPNRRSSAMGADMFKSMMNKKEKKNTKITSSDFDGRLSSTLDRRNRVATPMLANYGNKKVHILKTLQKVKRQNKIKDPKKAFKLLTQMEFSHMVNMSDSDSDQSIDSEIHNSLLDELDDDNLSVIDGKSAKPKTRNFTTIKISFKIDIVAIQSALKPEPLIIKKDRIYKSFHLVDIEFCLQNNSVCGVRLIFYDLVDEAYFAAQFHGQMGNSIQKAHFEMGELINKIHFASDTKEIHHIEIITTKGRSIVIGKTRKVAEEMKLAIVNRYFSDKDMLYNFFAGFNKQTKKIAYIRFLFVRKNLIPK